MKELEKQVRSILEAAKPKKSVINSNPSATRRLRFSIGLLLVAIFVLVASFVLPDEDQWLWGGFAVILLFVGAWQFDKANKELFHSDEQCPNEKLRS